MPRSHYCWRTIREQYASCNGVNSEQCSFKESAHKLEAFAQAWKALLCNIVPQTSTKKRTSLGKLVFFASKLANYSQSCSTQCGPNISRDSVMNGFAGSEKKENFTPARVIAINATVMAVLVIIASCIG